jgi:xanthine/CO dehydrogenase XdhC/CoxF family maturation factor
MRELLRLLARLDDGGPAVLALLARKRGSGYRQAGARLLVFEDGETVGLLSGGCVEDHVREQALAEPGRRRRLVVDTTAVEEAVFGFGTGCAGVLEVVLEPVETGSPAFAFLRSLRERPRPAVFATVFLAEGTWAGELGRHSWREADRAAAVESDIVSEDLVARVASSLFDPLVGVGRAETDSGVVEWAIESFAPPPRLWVFGAGADVVPLVALAGALGWEVVVVAPSRRPEHAARFPDRPGLRLEEISPREALSRLPELLRDTRRQEAALLSTHSLLSDLGYLEALRSVELSYLGAISSPKRRQLLLERVAIDSALLHAPAGLRLGGGDPEDVALSVIAEIQQALNSR